jgi:hypothetical protein
MLLISEPQIQHEHRQSTSSRSLSKLLAVKAVVSLFLQRQIRNVIQIHDVQVFAFGDDCNRFIFAEQDAIGVFDWYEFPVV